MIVGHQFKRALALSTALSVAALGATTTSAQAALDPGGSQGKSHSAGKGHAAASASSQGKSRGHSGERSSAGSVEQDSKAPKDKGSKSAKDAKGSKNVKGAKDAAAGDPAGNNGTVKITPHGEIDGIPQNTPHVDCVFDVEWYGFDEGDGIVSKVAFESWAPTAVAMVVDGPAEVFVGDDPASGAGVGSDEDGTDADNGFDGEATYTLSFPEGGAHPQQGYHVKLTINTPGSQGADVKHKVFWVQGCDDDALIGGEEETDTDIGGEEETDSDIDTDIDTDDTVVAGEEQTDAEGEQEGADLEVFGEQGTGANDDVEVKGAQGVKGAEALPIAVDAGLQAAKWVASPSPTPLYVALFGAMLAGLGLLIRRRLG